MIISEEYQDCHNGMVYCSASFTEGYMVRFADDYFYNFVGKQVGIKLTEIIHPDCQEEFTGAVSGLSEGDSVRMIIMVRGYDDLYHTCDVHIRYGTRHDGPEHLYDAEILGLYSMGYRYLKINDSANKYKTFLAMYRDYLYDYDFETDIFSILYYDNVKATVLLKGHFEEIREKIVSILDDKKAAEDVTAFLGSIKNCNEAFTSEFDAPSLEDHNRRSHYYINSRIVYKHNRSKVVIGIIRCDDNDSSIAYYEKPEGKDYFTGLLNKKACQAFVNDAIQKGDSLHYLIMMDVDNFKNVNDQYGHLCGDQVILKMAEIINKAVAGRGIVGRFGGDEFFIFTNSISRESDLRSMLTYIKKMMKQEFQDQFGGEGLTASMGVSAFPTFGHTYDELFNTADKCLYIAKEKGKNRFIIYDPEKHGEVITDDGKITTGISEVAKGSDNAAETLSGIILKLTGYSSYTLGMAVKDLAFCFGIDGVRIYTRSWGEMLCHYGDYRNLSALDKLIFTTEYTSLFQDKSYSSTSLIENLELSYPEIYKANSEAGIGGYFACRHATRCNGELIIFFDNIGRKCNITQADREMMMLVTAIIAGIFEE